MNISKNIFKPCNSPNDGLDFLVEAIFMFHSGAVSSGASTWALDDSYPQGYLCPQNVHSWYFLKQVNPYQLYVLGPLYPWLSPRSFCSYGVFISSSRSDGIYRFFLKKLEKKIVKPFICMHLHPCTCIHAPDSAACRSRPGSCRTFHRCWNPPLESICTGPLACHFAAVVISRFHSLLSVNENAITVLSTSSPSGRATFPEICFLTCIQLCVCLSLSFPSLPLFLFFLLLWLQTRSLSPSPL